MSKASNEQVGTPSGVANSQVGPGLDHSSLNNLQVGKVGLPPPKFPLRITVVTRAGASPPSQPANYRGLRAQLKKISSWRSKTPQNFRVSR